MPTTETVLLLGSGGREHALAWKAAQSPLLKKLYCAPGSSAIGEIATCEKIDILDPKAVTEFAKKIKADLVIIGPEASLAVGVADALRAEGIEVLGPGQKAAQLESSKAFAKEFMGRHKIPTAGWDTFTDLKAARSAVGSKSLPVVIKADGLASGKGVFICHARADAMEAVTQLMEQGAMGGAGKTLVVEDFIEGPEISAIAFVDGKDYRLFPFSRDHKRLKDGDEGPNTGGMGAFAPAEVDPKTAEAIRTQVFDRVIAGLKADGLDFRGILFVGLILTKEGPQVLEFNCRFGDPETQALMTLLDSDLVALSLACAEGKLAGQELKSRPGTSICVTLASEGYPSKPVTGRVIEGLPKDSQDLIVFHAGTARKGSAWSSSGGRVLGVTSVADDLPRAREKAYAAIAHIRFDGMQYRKDIGGIPKPLQSAGKTGV